jgi:hypothetical protein
MKTKEDVMMMSRTQVLRELSKLGQPKIKKATYIKSIQPDEIFDKDIIPTTEIHKVKVGNKEFNIPIIQEAEKSEGALDDIAVQKLMSKIKNPKVKNLVSTYLQQERLQDIQEGNKLNILTKQLMSKKQDKKEISTSRELAVIPSVPLVPSMSESIDINDLVKNLDTAELNKFLKISKQELKERVTKLPEDMQPQAQVRAQPAPQAPAPQQPAPQQPAPQAPSPQAPSPQAQAPQQPAPQQPAPQQPAPQEEEDEDEDEKEMDKLISRASAKVTLINNIVLKKSGADINDFRREKKEASDLLDSLKLLGVKSSRLKHLIGAINKVSEKLNDAEKEEEQQKKLKVELKPTKKAKGKKK